MKSFKTLKTILKYLKIGNKVTVYHYRGMIEEKTKGLVTQVSNKDQQPHFEIHRLIGERKIKKYSKRTFVKGTFSKVEIHET